MNDSRNAHTTAKEIAQQWLDEMAFTAATWNLDAHMQLVSKQVQVTGIPRIESIDYSGWHIRRKNEFEKKLLHSLNYRLQTIHSHYDGLLHFSVEEIMRGFDGKALVIDKEVTLHREEDGRWRVRREHFARIRPR